MKKFQRKGKLFARMQLRMKKYRQVGMKTMKTYTHRTSMAWTQIIKMMINKRNFKVLLNYVFQKKMMNKTFADTYRVSKHPHFPSLHPGTCSSDRGRARRSRRRRRTRRSRKGRIASSQWRMGPSFSPFRTPPCHRGTSLTQEIRADQGESGGP